MSEIREIEIQDKDDNIYYPHTASEVVKYENTNVKEVLDNLYPIIEATGVNNYVGKNSKIKTIEKGFKCTLFVDTDSTGECTLVINDSNEINIKDINGNIVTNLKADIPYNICYNGQDFILQGKGGDGNLEAEYLLEGYYGEGKNGRVDGSMINRGIILSHLSSGETYTLQKGYYESGTITANSLSKEMIKQGITLENENQLAEGITAINKNGEIITGTLSTSSSDSDKTRKYFNTYKGTSSDEAQLSIDVRDCPFDPKVITFTVENQEDEVTGFYDLNIGKKMIPGVYNNTSGVAKRWEVQTCTQLNLQYLYICVHSVFNGTYWSPLKKNTEYTIKVWFYE